MKPKNISLSDFRKYLVNKGLKHTRTKGSHEIWVRKDLTRPVVLQSSIDPIPSFVVKNNLRTIGEEYSDLIRFLAK